MALFKFGKKKKEEPMDISAEPLMQPQDTALEQPSSPVEQAMMMKQQGYTNNQIAQMLQSQGYNSSQVYDAINQAGMGGNSQPEQLDSGMPDYGQYEQPPPPQYQQESFQPPREIPAPSIGPRPSADEERIQEVAEAIIDEKWEEFAGDVKKIIEWKERSEDRLAKIEQQIIDLRIGMDSLMKSIMAKVQSYDQNIIDVGTEIKAMEKVFQKVLPSLTESVNKLDRMTKGVKEPQVKK